MAKKLTKKTKAALGSFDPKQIYDLDKAIEIAKKTATTKFESSIDIAIKLNLDTTKAYQQLRGAISLPHNVSKPIRILAITDQQAEAKQAGADFVGEIDKINEIKAGWMDFDVIITNPKFMIELGKLGKILGPKGLMPNPKTGTVTQDIATAITEYRKGKKEYRTDTFGNIHMTVGKQSTDTNKIVENANALIDLIKSRRPSAVKGVYIQNISVSSTMGPGVKVKIN
ncbi:50S ribosomal protein L1 [Mycoplasmoides gallisepticum]|uniref:50S ribosomal protein L1 n=1 Tax=Mycoplasmoides gallisepticum TaxID=2096 RepID=UPI001EF3DC8E|nr:50S ribosomal protein L1 [Mycoplasmoides gallisepticum]ULH67541.1 50S ribosomal protein L1 [Mycoplasmoides gallisepticum]